MMKIFKFIPILLFFSTFMNSNVYGNTLNSSENDVLKCVVIDAGHGGNDPGATFGKIYEKNIALSVALKLGKMISVKYPSVKIVYTRKTDIFIPLSRRSQIANDAKADLFISIHVNSAENKSARGVETFLMGTNKSDQNMAIAMKENSVITLEDDYKQTYEGFEPNSAESYIIFSLMQYSSLENSRIFASAIQEEYGKRLKTPNRGVKQAGFLVLWKASMPSVLTEIGFVSNSQDRSFLTSQTKQTEIALSLFNAFSRYKRQMDSGVKEISVSPINTEDIPHIEVVEQPQNEIQESKNTQEIQNTVITSNGDVEYRVQISSTKNKSTINSANFGKYHRKIEFIRNFDRYVYYIPIATYAEAKILQKRLRSDRFKDAFVVAYENGRKIDIKRAISITEK